MAGKTYAVYGDSISTFEGVTPPQNRVYYEGGMRTTTGVESVDDTWWMQVIESLGGTLSANAAYSGCLVTGDGFPAGCSSERACQIVGDDGGRPDAVLVYMGINDYGEGTPIDAFERAYDGMLCELKSVAPDASLICCTLLPGRSEEHDVDFFRAKYKGVDLGYYNDAIRRAALKNGVVLADIAETCHPFDTLDGTHPTKKGMRQLADAVLSCGFPA